ncbi:hypothetical protein FRC12_010701 [Ceratobasidium sp. 428]|nr:hypothetical protein FRC12_010701 [Ceratobasidium sp. 428]
MSKIELISICRGIERELDVIRRKQWEGGVGTYLNASTDADKILEHYRRIQALLQRITMNINFKTLQLIDEQATENRLKSLLDSSAAKYNSVESSSLRYGCTQDTRLKVLDDLYEWACDDKSQGVCWLNGMAGTGKTTIAYSLCERLKASERLAASFFCSRQLPACRNVNRIVPTISYQLSRFSRPFRFAISRVLEEDPDAHNQVLHEQFKKLIAETLVEVKDALPTNLVVVIDALDECDDTDGVDRMLDALLLHMKELPIKLFIASRPDAKILDRMRSQHGKNICTELRLHEVGHSTVQQDIRRYLTVMLSRPCVSLTAANFNTLVERSGVLFIYASTIVRYIGYDNFSRASSRLRQILELTKDSSSDSEKDMNVLYSAILKTAFSDPNLTSKDLEEMKLVLHTVVCAQEPLSVDAMAGLLELEAETVWAALRPLFSVLHVLDATQTITTLHESFPDYLLNKSRSGMFYCDANKHHTFLAQLCFIHIKLVSIPFNICNLESSYVFDEDVPDLPARVEKAISKHLLYACRHLLAHCMSAEVSRDLASMLREFVSERFLLWMEVMNLSGNIEGGVRALDQAQEWPLDTPHLNDNLREFLRDMWMFADEFASTEARLSTPHIYVSTLTFWPDHSPISDHYGQQHTCLITERSTAISRRKSSPAGKLEGQVFCVSYSPDGTHIASGTACGVMCIWSALTGQLVGQSMEGHTGCVRTIAYSPDGVHILSGSDDSTMRIWDAHNCHLVGQPLQGHTRGITTALYSPDGAYIVSGSDDNTIRIWDAHTHQPVGQPLMGHTQSVSSAAYAPDGAHIVSGSDDQTVRIWDAHSRQPVGQPLVGHTWSVTSVAYSPDGAHIVSGSLDRIIRIWDAHTRQPVGRPLRGHTRYVQSVAYSPNNAYIVSGSLDNTLRIWDAHTRQPARQPLQGHAGNIQSVAYSPDGAEIVSGSNDTTIRVWSLKLALPMDGVSKIVDGQSRLVQSLSAISEPRILCNLGCQTDCSHMDWTLNDDGWVVFNGNKLIWVPPDFQEVLLRPQNTALMSMRGFLQLDLDRNKLGEHWRRYFQPRKTIDL